MAEHPRIDHSSAGDLDPSGLLANGAALPLADMAGEVDFDGRLGEREEVRAEADRHAIAHHLLGEVREDRLEVRERNRLRVDVEPLDLVEVRRVRRVRRVATVRAPRAYHADRRLVLHHRADLHRRGLRPQEAVVAEPERVAPIHRRMVRGRVERREVVEPVLELGTVRDREAELAEYRGGLLDDAGERMLHSERAPAPREREIGVHRLLARRARALRGERRLNFRAPGLHGLAERGTLLLRDVLHRLDERRNRSVAADILHAKRLHRRGIRRRRDLLQAFRLRILEFCKSHFTISSVLGEYYTLFRREIQTRRICRGAISSRCSSVSPFPPRASRCGSGRKDPPCCSRAASCGCRFRRGNTFASRRTATR